MAHENLIFPLERKYFERQTVGSQIQYVLDSKFKGGGIPVRMILDIVCKYALNGNCQFYEIKHGPIARPIKVIIDKNQYDELMALANN